MERWKGAVDDKKLFEALLTDLSKVFVCLFHELIIAKLNAYSLSLPAYGNRVEKGFNKFFF